MCAHYERSQYEIYNFRNMTKPFIFAIIYHIQNQQFRPPYHR